MLEWSLISSLPIRQGTKIWGVSALRNHSSFNSTKFDEYNVTMYCPLYWAVYRWGG
jgi:hypothetical protein